MASLCDIDRSWDSTDISHISDGREAYEDSWTRCIHTALHPLSYILYTVLLKKLIRLVNLIKKSEFII